MFYYDWTYIFILIGAVLSLLASAKVKSSFAKYSRVMSKSGMTAKEVAERILSEGGVGFVKVEPIAGELTDHYDPSAKVLRLSESVYSSTSVAAIGVAAHECGHAIQDEEQYFPMQIRSFLVPVVNFGNRLSMPLFIAGIILGLYNSLVPIGIFLFSFAVLFHVITLPVEFDASIRAVRILKQTNILDQKEAGMAGVVLRSAAYTYLAAVAASALQLLRLILIARNGRRRD